MMKFQQEVAFLLTQMLGPGADDDMSALGTPEVGTDDDVLGADGTLDVT